MHFQLVFGDLIEIYFFSNSHLWNASYLVLFYQPMKVKIQYLSYPKRNSISNLETQFCRHLLHEWACFLIYKYGCRTDDLQCHSLLSTLMILFFTIIMVGHYLFSFTLFYFQLHILKMAEPGAQIIRPLSKDDCIIRT